MREIDINIEGFNVNGICVGCLNYKRKMYYDFEVKECFKLLANIDVPDGLEIQVCWECLARVKTVSRFQAQILKSYSVLIDYSRKHMFLNCPSELTDHATSRLSMSALVTEELSGEPSNNDEDEKVEIKVEVPEENVDKVDIEDTFDKIEDAFDKIGDMFEVPILSETVKTETEDYQEESHFDGDAPSQENVSSDDEVLLSKIKKKKDKKSKKKGKKRKSSVTEDSDTKNTDQKHKVSKTKTKLKNLPDDLVELYTMTEEEMWTVRAEDVINKDFLSLRYRCDNCILGFHTEKLMKYHLEGKHSPKGDDCYRCEICKAYFVTHDNVSSHRALHFTAFRCRQCDYRTSVKRLISWHILKHEARGHVCKVCHASFSTRSRLHYHRAICQREKPQCDCCGKVFANKMTLKYHLKVNNIIPYNKDEKPKEKLYIPCKGCNKVFHSKKSYRAHVVIHDGVTYPCPICGKLFQWKRNLARHTRNHRERDTHSCRECGKTFASKDCYNNHMRLSKRHVNADAYIHQCSYCGKKFATKYCMVDHIDWEHLKNIRYQCSVCFKAFKTSKILVAHVKNLHVGKKMEVEGEHLCEICGKSYKTEKRLKGHVWAMHTKRSTSKSFKCKLCPATFTWQTSIYKHMKMMHDNNKRAKTSRLMPVKKDEPYLAPTMMTRMQYFQQNIANNLQNTVQNVPTGLV